MQKQIKWAIVTMVIMPILWGAVETLKSLGISYKKLEDKEFYCQSQILA